MNNVLTTIIDYHQRTKHHLDRYARSLGYLDWATQPDPFRRFEGAPLHRLDLIDPADQPYYDAMHDVIGFKDLTFQSLYHFTVGLHVDDPRLQTHPPYAHLQQSPWK